MAPKDKDNLVAQVSDKVMGVLTPVLETHFGTVQKSIALLAKIVDMTSQSNDSKQLLQSRPIIRYTLCEDSGQTRVEDLRASGILHSLQKAGPPFDQITAVKIHCRFMQLIAKTETAEARIRAEAGRISEILRLSLHCKAIPLPHFVWATAVSKDEWPKPREYKDDWSGRNNVEISNAFWARDSLLILTLFKVEDAQKLILNGIQLGDNDFSPTQFVPPFLPTSCEQATNSRQAIRNTIIAQALLQVLQAQSSQE
ncbi:hypothetical protein ACHAPT_006630 [Fusarium lateritium]